MDIPVAIYCIGLSEFGGVSFLGLEGGQNDRWPRVGFEDGNVSLMIPPVPVSKISSFLVQKKPFIPYPIA